MIDRRTFVGAAAGGFLVAASPAPAQQPRKVARVGILHSAPDSSVSGQTATVFRQGLRDLGWVEGRNLALEYRSPDDLDAALRAGSTGGAKGLVMLSSPILLSANGSKRVAAFAAANRLPSIAPSRRVADAGGLMSYGPDLAGDLYRRAAPMVDKILKGAKPADLPIERPRKFELVINLKAARALGLAFPQSLLLRADEVIQ